ncbi:MAG: hypothetical protein ABMB14_37285 [Myxococcota bacterium]
MVAQANEPLILFLNREGRRVAAHYGPIDGEHLATCLGLTLEPTIDKALQYVCEQVGLADGAEHAGHQDVGHREPGATRGSRRSSDPGDVFTGEVLEAVALSRDGR